MEVPHDLTALSAVWGNHHNEAFGNQVDYSGNRCMSDVGIMDVENTPDVPDPSLVFLSLFTAWLVSKDNNLKHNKLCTKYLSISNISICDSALTIGLCVLDHWSTEL